MPPDERSLSTDKKSSSSQLNAASQVFVPASAQKASGSSENGKLRSPSNNVEIKPFVPIGNSGASPGSSRKINADAAPYVPSQPSPQKSAGGGGYQKYPARSPEGRGRGRSNSRADLRAMESSEFQHMAPIYPPMAMGAQRMPNGNMPMMEPAYPGRSVRPYSAPMYTPQRGGGPPMMLGPGQMASPPPPLHPQQSPPPELGNRGRGRGRGMGSMLVPIPNQAPPYFAGPAGMNGSLPVLARSHQNAALMSDQLMTHLPTRAYLLQAQMSQESLNQYGLPQMLLNFHSLKVLEESKSSEEISKAIGVSSLVLKGINIEDGDAFAIRRLSWAQIQPSSELKQFADEVVDAWRPVALHPNLSVPKLAFVALDQAERPILHVGHSYYPGATTLEAAHLMPQFHAGGMVQINATEENVWGYLLQIVAGLGAVHETGLACRAGLHPSKILLLPGGRLRLGSLGISEIVVGLSARHADLAYLHQEDLRAVGTLLLHLLCGSKTHASIEQVSAHCSPELTHIVASLTGHSEPFPSWHQLMVAVSERTFSELTTRAAYSDALTGLLAQEIENGRLMRLMVKLMSVLERADMGEEWTETGDRYLLKLFRDFAFHPTSEDGSPTMDWAHTVESLNKLDGASPEKIILMSRDEESMLIVTYADVKKCMENALSDLSKRGLPAYLNY